MQMRYAGGVKRSLEWNSFSMRIRSTWYQLSHPRITDPELSLTGFRQTLATGDNSPGCFRARLAPRIASSLPGVG